MIIWAIYCIIFAIEFILLVIAETLHLDLMGIIAAACFLITLLIVPTHLLMLFIKDEKDDKTKYNRRS